MSELRRSERLATKNTESTVTSVQKDSKSSETVAPIQNPSIPNPGPRFQSAAITLLRLRCSMNSCDYYYSELSQLEEHLRMRHQMRGIFICHLPDCTESFNSSTQLQIHISVDHPDALKSQHFPCNKCPATFSRYKDMTEHFYDGHREGIWGCSSCSHETDSREDALRHIEETHHEER